MLNVQSVSKKLNASKHSAANKDRPSHDPSATDCRPR